MQWQMNGLSFSLDLCLILSCISGMQVDELLAPQAVCMPNAWQVQPLGATLCPQLQKGLHGQMGQTCPQKPYRLPARQKLLHWHNTL